MSNSALVDLYFEIDRVAPESRTQTARALHDEIANLARGQITIDALSEIELGRRAVPSRIPLSQSDSVGAYIKITTGPVTGSGGAGRPVCPNANCPNR